ncbi:MAG: NADP-dependent phosphogluconate dehydrogenase [Halocynthiibacter sp.]
MSNSDIGLIGLGTMGAMLALNIAENGFSVSVFNRTVTRTQQFYRDAGALAAQITPTESLEALVGSLAEPRAIILMVPAGKIVDEQIALLRRLLGRNDLIIDAGNANFRDTDRRAADAVRDGVPFLGVGVSGGAEGARFGPSIMGGGPRDSWRQIAPILEAISAKYRGKPCATWMGDCGAGHFVKTVHNGIEYAYMQMIAEVYGILRDGMNKSANDCAGIFRNWNTGALQSYLIEISGEVSAAKDGATGQPVLDIILDRAGQKGTGRWTAIEAQHLGAPIPVIEAAVAARNISAALDVRKAGEALFGAAPQALVNDPPGPDDLEGALIAGKIMCYAQGFALLTAASESFDWALPMPDIAEVWREGCIIRSAMLNDMASALSDAPDTNLMFAPFFADLMRRRMISRR